MIYLIGGAPRVGKSVVGKRIAAQQKATLISTDDVCDEMIKTLSPEEKQTKFPLPGFSGTASENTLTPEEWVQLQVVSAKSLEPALDKIITQAIQEHQDLVVEGVQLLPEYVRRLMVQHDATQFVSIFIGSHDIDRVVEGIMKDVRPSNWMRESDPAVIRQVAWAIAAFSVYVQKEAAQSNLPYQERTEDFERDMSDLSERLLKGIVC